jgi:hypothetical protein
MSGCTSATCNAASGWQFVQLPIEHASEASMLLWFAKLARLWQIDTVFMRLAQPDRLRMVGQAGQRIVGA